MLHDAAEQVVKHILKKMAGQPSDTRMPTQAAVRGELNCAPATVVEAFRRMRDRKLVYSRDKLDYLADGGVTPRFPAMTIGSCRTKDMLALRRGVEGVSVELVAERVKTGSVGLRSLIEKLLERVQDSKATRKIETHEAVDWEVHSGLVALSDNVAVQREWRLMESQYEASIRNNVRRLCIDRQYREDNCRHHQCVLEFVLHGEPRQAREAMEAHLHHATSRLRPEELSAPLRWASAAEFPSQR